MKTKIFEKLLLIFFDSIIILISFIGAYFLRLGTFHHSQFLFGPYLQMAMIMIPIWILLLSYEGRYSLKEKNMNEEFRILFFASLASVLLFPLIFYFKNELFFSRGILAILLFLACIFLFGLSILQKKISQFQSKNNTSISRMLVIGANRSAENIIKNLIENFSYHKPVAILTPYGSKKKNLSGVPILGKLDALEKIFIEYQINEIFLCEGVEHSQNLDSFCKNKGIPLRTSLETLGIYNQDIQSENIGNATFLTIYQSPLFGWGQFFKRIFDIGIASIGIIIFAPYFFVNRKYLTTKKFKNGVDSTFFRYIFKK